MSVQPLFVFSLPRSGSTLLQRVLATYPDVATASEPWILLPLLSTLREDMPLAGRRHAEVAAAIGDFAAALPGGPADYEAELREVALRLYSRASANGARWFLDKSPSYLPIVGEIVRVFPDARFVFLFRNPLGVLSSIVETFCSGRFEPHRYRVSLFHGVDYLLANRDAGHSVRFEDLVSGADEPWRGLAAYLGLEYDPATLGRFADVRLEGRMGDPTGVDRYRSLSSEPIAKWRETLGNPLRRAWAARYLRWLGRERLGAMGYDLDALLADLRAAPSGGLPPAADVRSLGASLARDLVKARLPKGGGSSWRMLLGA